MCCKVGIMIWNVYGRRACKTSYIQCLGNERSFTECSSGITKNDIIAIIFQHMHNFSPLYYLYPPTCFGPFGPSSGRGEKLCMCWKIIAIITENARNNTRKNKMICLLNELTYLQMCFCFNILEFAFRTVVLILFCCCCCCL
jgi:hypothetical protein